MNWKTVYISGKSDFREDVRKKLEHADQRFMPGFIESPMDGELMYDLYWLDGLTSVKAFKHAMGAKLIWKYRLRFFPSLEALRSVHEAPDENRFSLREQQMMNEMRQAS
ncbi:MAG: hypothetical protein K2U26_10995 [Cyclobacteriaceae bacterium]|nr:hypothetical protein [Cyclobacteriaceae bacterium]